MAFAGQAEGADVEPAGILRQSELRVEVNGEEFAASDQSGTLADILAEIRAAFCQSDILVAATWNRISVPADLWSVSCDKLSGILEIRTVPRSEFFADSLSRAERNVKYLTTAFQDALRRSPEEVAVSGAQRADEPSYWNLVDDFNAFAEWMLTVVKLDTMLARVAEPTFKTSLEQLRSIVSELSLANGDESAYFFKQQIRTIFLPMLASYADTCRQLEAVRKRGLNGATGGRAKG